MADERARLEAARDLIKEKQYEAARVVLKTISTNATAHDWLTKLNKVAPENLVAVAPKGNSRGLLSGALVVVILLLIAALIWTNRSTFGLLVAAVPTATQTPLPTNTPTSSPTFTHLPTNTPTPTFTLTLTSTRTPQPTSTPMPTATLESTNTTGPTNTPLPTNTNGPTNTPLPTDTPRPSPTRTPKPQSIVLSPDGTPRIRVSLLQYGFSYGSGFAKPKTGYIYLVASVNVQNISYVDPATGTNSLQVSDFDFKVLAATGTLISPTFDATGANCDLGMVQVIPSGNAQGCVTFEVPESGQLSLVYAPFEYDQYGTGRQATFVLKR